MTTTANIAVRLIGIDYLVKELNTRNNFELKEKHAIMFKIERLLNGLKAHESFIHNNSCEIMEDVKRLLGNKPLMIRDIEYLLNSK